MIFKNYCKNFFMFFLFFAFTSVFANEINVENVVNTSSGNSKLSRCVTCHTITGNSISTAWPKIAEQHSDYMLKQLFEFKKGKSGNRFDPTMLGMLQGVTESEMYELIDHFSKQTLEKSKLKIDSVKFESGKNLYLYGKQDEKLVACVGCHGIDGTGNKLANFPSLKWQHKDYLVTQLKKFKSGDRSNDINGIMRDVASNMSQEHMDAISTYISFMD